MAAPNIIGATTITGKTVLSNLTTVTANVLTNSSSSGTVDKLNSIMLSNYTSSSVGANVVIDRSGTTYYLGGNLSIPGNSTLVVLAKDTGIYLEEGDVLQANATANSSITLTTSYELISG